MEGRGETAKNLQRENWFLVFGTFIRRHTALNIIRTDVTVSVLQFRPKSLRQNFKNRGLRGGVVSWNDWNLVLF